MRLRHVMRAWRWISALILLAILGLGAGSVAWRLWNATHHLDQILVATLEQALGREVRVDSVDVLRPGVIELHGMAIAERDRLADGALLTLPRAVVRYNLWDVLFRRLDPVKSISTVDLYQPSLVIERDRDNRFNLQKLFKPTERVKPSPFRGVVRVHDATVFYRDYNVKALPTPQRNTLQASATVDASGPPLILFEGTGAGDGLRVGGVTVLGTYRPDTGALRVRVNADSQTLPYWLPYFASIPSVSLTSGSGGVAVDVWKPGVRRPVEATIGVRVDRASGTTSYTRAPLTDLRGSIVISTGVPLSTQLDLQGTSAGIPVGVYGSIFTGATPRMAIRATAQNATMAGLQRILGRVPSIPAVRPLAPASGEVYIYGPTSDPTVTGRVRIPEAILYQTRVRDAVVDIRYRDRQVELPSITAVTLAGDRLTARASLDLRTNALRVVADAPSMTMRSLGLTNLPLTGNATAHVMVTGTTQSPQTSALITVRDGRYEDLRFNRLVARVTVQGSRVQVHNAVAELPSGVLMADGTVTTGGRIDLGVRVAGLALERLLPELGYRNIAGTAFFRGRITGSLQRLGVQGDARIFNVRAGQQSLDLVSGPVAWNGNRLSLNNVRVARYPSQGIVRGTATVRPDGEMALDMVAELETGRLETLLADAGIRRHEASGAVTGTARIRGTTARPDVTGSVNLTDGTVTGYPVQTASAEFIYRNSVLEIRDARAQSDEAFLNAPSLRLVKGRLDGSFTAERVSLARLGPVGAPYAALEGVLEIQDGSVSGTMSRPDVQATIRIPDLSVNSLHFENNVARIGWDGAALEITGLQMERNGAVVLAVPFLRWNETWGGAQGQVRTAGLAAQDIRTLLERSTWVRTAVEAEGVREMLADLPDPFDGRVGLDLRFGGRFQDLTGRAELTVNDVVFGSQSLDELSLTAGLTEGVLRDGRLRDGLITVEENGLYARHEDEEKGIDMLVRGAFAGRISGAIANARLEAFNVPVSYLHPFLPPGRARSLNGKVDTLTVIARGETKSPVLTASLEGSVIYDTNGPDQANGEMPTVRVSTEAVTVREGEININGIRLTARGQSAVVAGTIPFRWSPLGVPPQGEMNLTANLEQQNLNALELISAASGRRVIQKADGVIAGQVSARGTPSSPRLEGFLEIQKGSVDVIGLESGFRDLDMRLVFQNNELLVERLSVASTAGGTLEARPGSRIRQISLTRQPSSSELDITLVPKGFRILETRNALGYGERVRATLESGQVNLRQTLRAPLIQGEVTLTNMEVTPPNQSPPAMPATTAREAGPRFDLTLIAGRNVWVQNPLFRIKMDDRVRVEQRSLRITGAMRTPAVSGTLISREGVFNYPTARFRLTDALIEIRYPRPDTGTGQSLPPVYVNANAESRVYATISGRRRPVTVFMHIEGPTTGVPAGASPFETLAPYRIELRSSPSLPERQLVALISREEALQRLAQGEASADEILKQETLNILQASILPEALSGFESQLSDLFGLESLTLDYETVDRYVNVSATKRLWDKFVLTYTTPVASAAAGEIYTFQVSYEFTPRLRLTLEQRKGPFLRGSPVTGPTSVNPAVGDPMVRETSILLEGGLRF